MSAKEIEIDCPCCSARLVVDVLTSRVMRTEKRGPAAEKAGDAWTSAQSKVQKRTASGSDKLDAALESERGKKDRLDDLFDRAKKKVERGDDDG